MFINLGIHSYYSLLMSSISIDDIISFAVINKQEYVCLVDINSMYGTVEFYQKAIKSKLKPIIGLQITYQNEKVVLIAKDYNGYLNLVKISSAIMCNKEFDINSYLTNVFVLVNDISKTSWLKNNKYCYSINDNATNPIAYHECYFEKEEDFKYLKVLKAISQDQKLVELQEDNSFKDCYLWKDDKAKEKFSKKSLENLDYVISQCNWEMKLNQEINFIKYDQRYASNILLQTKCKEGLKQRLNSLTAPREYIERLKYELDIIHQMKFDDYFLVVQDYVNFAKHSGILVGPGRGSAAGSLVAYVLGITDIDPIKYNLIFERFLNPERTSMPDIDIDFMDNRRNEIIQYLFEKYGLQHVAHIVVFQRMKAKMAIRDVGRILDIELPIINNISKLIPYEYELDLNGAIENDSRIKSFSSKYPELFEMANKFLDFPRQIGLHAAGIVISNSNLTDVIPIQSNIEEFNISQYSMEYLEPLGLIKMDILGLVNLTTIEETIKLIEKNHNIAIELSKIPINDKKVFQQLSNGDTIGIFQLESEGMTNLITKIKPVSIEDISICSALYRPGPQKNIPTYLANKANPKSIKYLNNDFKEVLSPTYNIIIYQEQVIEIVKRVANFSLAKADLFRRAISKKDAIKLQQLKEQFIEGGLTNKYSKEELEQIFDYVYEFANYGFNHSHSLAYSYVSYWMAYLKTYYPLEYFLVLLNNSSNSVDKISTYIRSIRQLKIKISQPSINKSSYDFSIVNKTLIFGFNSIKGIGSETINKILTVREKFKEFKDYTHAIMLLATNGVGVKVIETLIKAGCFDELLEGKTRTFLLHNLNELFEKSKTMTVDGSLIIEPNIEDVKETEEMKIELSQEQFNLLGISLSEHPVVKYRNDYKGEYKIVSLKQIQLNTVEHTIAIVTSVRQIMTRTNKSMAFAKIEDDTKTTDVAIFPAIYEKVKDILEVGKAFLIGIRRDDKSFQMLSLRQLDE